MGNYNKVSKMLIEDDYIYLSTVFDLEIDIMRGMDDADWCQFIGCSNHELPYYLFEDGEPMGEVSNLADEAAFDEIEDLEHGLFDLEAYLQEHASDPPLPQATVAKKPKVSVRPATTYYSSPSSFASKPKAKVIPHHFEIIR